MYSGKPLSFRNARLNDLSFILLEAMVRLSVVSAFAFSRLFRLETLVCYLAWFMHRQASIWLSCCKAALEHLCGRLALTLSNTFLCFTTWHQQSHITRHAYEDQTLPEHVDLWCYMCCAKRVSYLGRVTEWRGSGLGERHKLEKY